MEKKTKISQKEYRNVETLFACLMANVIVKKESRIIYKYNEGDGEVVLDLVHWWTATNPIDYPKVPSS